MTTQMSKVKEELRGTIKGSVLVPDDPGYEEARQVWNAMIDRRPAVIVQCAQADDVPPVIRFARKNGLQLSIRGGGHQHRRKRPVRQRRRDRFFKNEERPRGCREKARVCRTWGDPGKFR